MIEFSNKRTTYDIKRDSDLGKVSGTVEIRDAVISNMNYNVTAETGEQVCYVYYSEMDGKANRNINSVDTDKQSLAADLLDTIISEIKSAEK